MARRPFIVWITIFVVVLYMLVPVLAANIVEESVLVTAGTTSVDFAFDLFEWVIFELPFLASILALLKRKTWARWLMLTPLAYIFGRLIYDVHIDPETQNNSDDILTIWIGLAVFAVPLLTIILVLYISATARRYFNEPV